MRPLKGLRGNRVDSATLFPRVHCTRTRAGRRCKTRKRTATDMEKTIHALMHGTFNVMKGPLLLVLLLSIVVSLVRHPPGRLLAARARKPLPPA